MPRVIPSVLYVKESRNTGDLSCNGTKRSDGDLKYVAVEYFIEKAVEWMMGQPAIDDVLSSQMLEEFRRAMSNS